MIGLCDLCLVVPRAPRTCAWHGPRHNRGADIIHSDRPPVGYV